MQIRQIRLSKPIKIIGLTILGFCSIPGLVMLFSFFLNVSRPPFPPRVLIPTGYTGLIKIEYGVKGAPPLTVEQGHYLHRIPPDGHLQTCTYFPSGCVNFDEWYYVKDQIRTTLVRKFDASDKWLPNDVIVWGAEPTIQSADPSITEVFFVGTAKQCIRDCPDLQYKFGADR